MRSNIWVSIAVLVLFFGLSFFLLSNSNISQENMVVFSNPEIGLEFEYRGGEEGYVLEEKTDLNSPKMVKQFILIDKSEKENLEKTQDAREGPPVISISVIKNTEREWPAVWVERNNIYSNINLKIGEVSEAVLGGANAVSYISDGLYASYNVVVAHGENVYVFSGMYLDQDSEIYRDFMQLLNSVKFIPKI